MPAVAKTTPQRAGRRRSSIGGRIVLSDRKNTPSQQLRKTPVKTKKTTPRPRRSASADSKRGRPRSNSTISTTRSSSADTKPIARRISTEPETPFGKAEAMAAAAAHMLKLKETPPPHKEDGTPFSKAEALAAAASHILTLRSRREEATPEAVKTVEFASGPLGVEFEPEELDGDGCEVGCVVVRVHDASRYHLRPGDVLTAIDSVSTKDWPFSRIVEALKTRPDPCKATFETTSVKEPSKSLFMKTPADVNREILDAKGAADLALFSTCAKIEDLQTAMPVPSTGAARARMAARPPYDDRDQTAPKSNDSTEGAFATPLLAAELRALHDELAVAASDNVSLADALEKQRRSEREAQSSLANALSPDKRPPQDEDLAVFAQRVAEALRRAKDELAAQRSAGEDLEQARRLSEEASQALRTHKAQSEQELNDLKRDCDERLQRAANMSQQAAQAFRGAVDEARRERDVVKSEFLEVRASLKEARSDLECTEGAYSEREAALAERCDSAERRCQELDAELTTAQRDASEWKRSAQDFEETSKIIERKVSELEATVSRQRNDSARKATQWESRCSELEDALDQSARDFEAMRAESERVKEAKQALQEAVAMSERELDEKLRARDRQISRLEAQLEKGASRAQKDQEHADELCRAHEKALQARDDEHRSAVAGAQKRFENKLREAHKTHATELETALQRARQEAEASRRRDAAYHERRYAAAEASHNDAMREATLAERVANRAARDASEKRLRQTIDTAVRRADDAAAERDDAQYEAERAGAAATRKALAASEAVFAKRLSDSDRAAAASTSALLAAADAKRFEALRAERAAGDASRLLAVAAAGTTSDALSEARRDCEVFRQRSIAANDRAADEVRNARRAEAHAKAAEARCREAEDALDQLQRSSHAEAAQLRLESERLGLELVALQEEVDVQANGELRQCRANDQLSKNVDAIQRDRDAQKASLDLVTAEVARLTDELRRKETQLQDADADGFRALDASARADAEAQKSKAALEVARQSCKTAEARVLALEKDVMQLKGERDDLMKAVTLENAAAHGDRQALVELAQARKARDADFASLQAVCESLREDVKRLEAHKATALSADTLRREAALAVAAVRAEARRELSKSDKGRIQAEEQLKKCLSELRDKDDFVRRHRAELENARARMAESDSKLVEIKKALKREVREAAEQAAEARADAEVAVASARGEALRLEDEVERLSAALRGRDDSNMEAEHLAHDLLTLSRENDALRGATEDVSSNLLRVARDHDQEQKRAAMNENRARKVEAEMEAMGGRVEAIARELPEQVKRLETAADKKVVDAAARALNAEERAEEAVHALREEEGCRLRTERALSDADTRADAADARAKHLAQQLHEAEIVRLKAERALRDAEKLGERLIGERQAISLDRDAAVAARDALACELKKAREDCRKARAELVSVQKAKAAADAACAAARSQTKVQARKRSQAAEAAGAELTRVADGLAASDRAAKTLAKRLQSLNASATGPVAVELRALARSLDASQRDAAAARRAVAAAEAKRAAGGYSAPEEELRGELARARDRADALEKELEIARRALDQKDGKVNNLKTFNSTICAFIESIAADEVNDGTDGPPPPAPPRSGKLKRRARRVLQQPVADSPAWR